MRIPSWFTLSESREAGRVERFDRGLGAFVVGGVAFAIGLAVWQVHLDHAGSLGWDQASHGVKGVIFAQDLSRGDVGRALYQDLVQQRHYPPMQTLVLGGIYLVTGTYHVHWAALGSTLAVALAILFGAWGAAALCPKAGGLALLLATYFAIGAPVFLAQGTIVMLEIFAAAALLACLGMYCKHLSEPPGSARAVGVGLASTALFLTAYNTAIFWTLTLALAEWFRLSGALRQRVLAALRNEMRPSRLVRPRNLVPLVLAVLCVVVKLTDGWEFSVLGLTPQVHNVGWPLYFLVVWMAGRVGWWIFARWEIFRAEVPRRLQDLVWSFVVPVFVWLCVLYPPKFAQVVDWGLGRRMAEDRNIWTGLKYYGSSLLDGFFVHWSVGAAALLAVVWGIIRIRQRPPGVKVALALLGVGFALTVGHPFKDTRFLVPLVPIIWVLAAHELATLATKLCRSASAVTVALVFALVASTPALGSLYAERLPALCRGLTGPRELDHAARWASEQTPQGARLMVLGQFVGLSHHLWEWHFRQRPDFTDSMLAFDLTDYRRRHAASRLEAKETFERWLQERTVDAVVCVEIDRSSPQWSSDVEAHHAWRFWYVEQMSGQSKYRKRGELDLKTLGIRLTFYEKSAAGAAGPPVGNTESRYPR